MSIIELVNSLVWGPVGAFSLLSVSAALCARCGFFHARHPLKTAGLALKSGGAANMAAALGGSVGVGNIAGVAVALRFGGAGALFWMVVCSFFSMILKFAETALAVKHKKGAVGGPMYYLSGVRGGKFLSKAFCVACILSSFGIGCTVQSDACARAFESVGVSSYVSGGLLAAACAVTAFGGGKRLLSIASKAVPVMSVFYIAGVVAVIFANVRVLPDVFFEIFRGAFGIRAIGGGFAGGALAAALRQGMSKGIFSSESGMGSSPIIYSYNNNDSPETQGARAMAEAFFDTCVMCTLTGLAILCAGRGPDAQAAFSSLFGDRGAWFLAISLFFFAFTSMSCWNFYGGVCVSFLFRNGTAKAVYNAAFTAMIFFGATVKLSGVWAFADLFNAVMICINTYGIVSLFPEIKALAPHFTKAKR